MPEQKFVSVMCGMLNANEPIVLSVYGPKGGTKGYFEISLLEAIKLRDQLDVVIAETVP